MILQGMVAANGGGGGAGHVPAAVGEDGTPSTRAAAGGVCSDLTQGGPGGAGGAGNSPDGQPGPTGAFWNGGGGGGGAGRIVTRTLTGTVDVGPNSLSPNTAGTFLRQTIDID
jgi:hypothetical protein